MILEVVDINCSIDITWLHCHWSRCNRTGPWLFPSSRSLVSCSLWSKPVSTCDNKEMIKSNLRSSSLSLMGLMYWPAPSIKSTVNFTILVLAPIYTSEMIADKKSGRELSQMKLPPGVLKTIKLTCLVLDKIWWNVLANALKIAHKRSKLGAFSR